MKVYISHWLQDRETGGPYLVFSSKEKADAYFEPIVRDQRNCLIREELTDEDVRKCLDSGRYYQEAEVDVISGYGNESPVVGIKGGNSSGQ